VLPVVVRGERIWGAERHHLSEKSGGPHKIIRLRGRAALGKPDESVRRMGLQKKGEEFITSEFFLSFRAERDLGAGALFKKSEGLGKKIANPAKGEEKHQSAQQLGKTRLSLEVGRDLTLRNWPARTYRRPEERGTLRAINPPLF